MGSGGSQANCQWPKTAGNQLQISRRQPLDTQFGNGFAVIAKKFGKSRNARIRPKTGLISLKDFPRGEPVRRRQCSQ
jgi:hypothetical protein